LWTEERDALTSLTLTASAYGNPFLFTGRRWDGRTGYYDYRTRPFDPAVGRFLSRDKIGVWGDPLGLGNGYAYVGNNPWGYVDPFGLEECDLSHGTPLGSRSIQLIWQNKAEDPKSDIYYDYANICNSLP
jgi:RHS repeat-associated protein